MLDLVLVICSSFGAGAPVPFQSMGFHGPDGKVTHYFCIDRHEIFGTVIYRSYSKTADGAVVFEFAPPLYSRVPPMIWAVPNQSLSWPLPGPSPYFEAFPSFKP
jgi:hypothetical protein